MASVIASNIFKQLIYYPESALGVLDADAGLTFTQPGSYTSAVGTKGEDELVLNFSSTTTAYPVGTKIVIGTNTYYTKTTLASQSRTTATLILDRALVADVTTMTIGAITYVNKSYSPKTLRRVSSNLDLKKETFVSNEIRSDQQIADQRTGANTVDGTVAGELSSFTYNDFFGALMRRDFTTGENFTTGSNLSSYTAYQVVGTSNVNSGATIVWNAGDDANFLKIKTGDIILTNNLHADLNDVPLLVLEKYGTTLKVTPATDSESLSMAVVTPNLTSVVFRVLGVKTWIPLTGHTKKSFAFEQFYRDVSLTANGNTTNYPVSELFTGVRPTQASIRMPSSGIATVDFSFMGIGAKKPSDAEFSALTWDATTKERSLLQNITGEEPLNSGIDTIYTAAVGSIYIRDKKSNGTVSKVGLITSLDLTINGNGSMLKVIGSTSSPDVAVGKLNVSGTMSIYFTDAKFRDMFLNEDEASIIAVFTENAGNSTNNSFMSFVMPRIKTGGATKDDSESIVMTVPFTALVGDGTNGFEATTLMIQDYAQLA